MSSKPTHFPGKISYSLSILSLSRKKWSVANGQLPVKTKDLPCSESISRTGWKACATNTFHGFGVPLEHEWLVPKLRLGTPDFPSKLCLDTTFFSLSPRPKGSLLLCR
ncbi:MAG: hypothetical protein C4567_01660 [Deltaproteobacteria bacterium]|nr:MAG: hypothetical protein C4567_01660 [Deltaproteobacteria bacterium]